MAYIMGECCCGGCNPNCSTCTYGLVLYFPRGFSNAGDKDYELTYNGTTFPFTDQACSTDGSGFSLGYINLFLKDCSGVCYDKFAAIFEAINGAGCFRCHDVGDLFHDVGDNGCALSAVLEFVDPDGEFADPFFYWWLKSCNDEDTVESKCCIGDEESIDFDFGVHTPGATATIVNAEAWGLTSQPCCEG